MPGHSLVHTPTLRDWLSLAALIMLWGTSFMFISLSLDSFSPAGIVTMRVLLAALILTAVMLLRGLQLPVSSLSWAIFLLFSIVGNLLPFYLISVGQKEVSSGIAGLLMAIMPLATMVLAHYFVAGENLNRFKIVGFILGITGVAMMLWPSIVGSRSDLFSSLLILLAALCYALNTIMVRRLPALDPLVTGSGVMIISSLIMVPFWFVTESPLQQNYDLTALVSVVWLGIGPTAIATLILFSLIGTAGPTFISYINYIIPVVAYFTGALILGEALEWRSLGALLLIIVGIGLTRRVPVR